MPPRVGRVAPCDWETHCEQSDGVRPALTRSDYVRRPFGVGSEGEDTGADGRWRRSLRSFGRFVAALLSRNAVIPMTCRISPAISTRIESPPTSMYSTACAFSARMTSRKSSGNAASRRRLSVRVARDPSLDGLRRTRARRLAIRGPDSSHEARGARDRGQPLNGVRRRRRRSLRRLRRRFARSAAPAMLGPRTYRVVRGSGPRVECDRHVDELQESHGRVE